MKTFSKKKGFTIVELVIVVAVIGVLTAILVPTFVNLSNKANEASNQAFVKNLNTAMAMREAEEGKNKTMSEAVEDARTIGFDVEKLTPVNGRDLVWDSVSNRFLLLEPNGDVWYGASEKQATKDIEIWKIYDSMPAQQKYSIYAKSGWTPATAGTSESPLTVGFDAGSAYITSVYYAGTQDVAIRTKNDQCVVTINAPQANVDFYGFAKELDVLAVKPASLHLYGAVNELAITNGHVAIEDTGIVLDVTQLGAADTGEGATLTNNGYIGEASLSAHSSAEAKGKAEEKMPENIGGDYAINSREKMEAFRDAVNGGNNFSEFDGVSKKVKLTADITLRDGWTPIGEGNREVVATNTSGTGLTTWFAGVFDGQGHKISNLNNKGFVPNENRLTYVKEGKPEKQYAWGLFGLVASGASFSNVVFDNVDFDAARYADALADSVGTLIGYAKGDLDVSRITVNGSLKGSDAISGVVGRITVSDGEVSIANCVNNASITSEVAASGIARAYKPASGHSFTLNGNTNNGTVISTYEHNLAGEIAVLNTGIVVSDEDIASNTAHGQAAQKYDAHGGNNLITAPRVTE